jgi:hypothetical protein
MEVIKLVMSFTSKHRQKLFELKMKRESFSLSSKLAASITYIQPLSISKDSLEELNIMKSCIEDLEQFYKSLDNSVPPLQNEKSIWKALYVNVDNMNGSISIDTPTTLSALSFGFLVASEPLYIQQMFQYINDFSRAYDNWTIVKTEGGTWFVVVVRGSMKPSKTNPKEILIKFYQTYLVPLNFDNQNLQDSPSDESIIQAVQSDEQKENTLSPELSYSKALQNLLQELEIYNYWLSPIKLNATGKSVVTFLSDDRSLRVMRGSIGGVYLLKRVTQI